MPHLFPEPHWPQPGLLVGQHIPSLKSGVSALQHCPEAQTSPGEQAPPPQQVSVPAMHFSLQHCWPEAQ